MDCTQPMMAADNDDSNSSITSADKWADKCVGVLEPVAGLENFPEELKVMGGENKIGRVRERCDITIDNKVRSLIRLSTSKLLNKSASSTVKVVGFLGFFDFHARDPKVPTSVK